MQVISQGSGAGIAPLRVFFQAFQADDLEVARHARADLRWRLWRVAANLVERLRQAAAHERSLARQQGVKNQRPDTKLEMQDFSAYALDVPSHSTDCIKTWRSAGCLTNGLRIPISLSGNSTSSTVLVRPAGG